MQVRKPDRLALVVLIAAATIVSGAFLLRPTDLHLPACSEPWDAAIVPWNFFWLDASFEAEERQLTEQRPTLPPEEFRKLSDAFDARVVEARRQQDERAGALAQEFDQRRRAFYARVAPILVMLMDRYQAKAIFDETSVLLADQSLNITDEVIAEIDARAAETAPEAAPEGDPAAPSPPEGTDGGE